MSGRSGSEETSVKDGERESVEFHGTVAADGVEAWTRGLNRLMRATDDLSGRKIGEEAEAVQVALFLRAWNTLYCAYDLAERGYYPQALNLLRSPIEDWMAYWYLRSFPEEYERFLDLNQQTPRFKGMLERIEAKHGKPPDRIVRGWIKRLHSYSHVDSKGIRMIMRHEGDVLQYGLGPVTHEVQFRYCVSQALGVIGAFLDALNNFRQLLGLPPIGDLADAFEDIERWQAGMRERYGATIDTDELPTDLGSSKGRPS